MTHTPWGKSQYADRIERGLTFHSTAGHGGVMVTRAYAEKHLSEAARKFGEPFNQYLCYEEDCLATIILFEIPQARARCRCPELVTDQALIESLSRWVPEYLIQRGITPVTKQDKE